MSICKVVAICLHLLLTVCVLCNATETGENIGPVHRHSAQFIGIATAIIQDPNGVQWLQVYVAVVYVMVMYKNDVEMPAIGTKVQILAIYEGKFRYPERNISIYKGLTWEAVHESD